MEADYYRELHELERKYLTKQQSLSDRVSILSSVVHAAQCYRTNVIQALIIT